MGYHIGFAVGCCEVIEYITYVASSSLSLGYMISTLNPSLVAYQPLIWLAFYVSALAILITGNKPMWLFNAGIAVVSLLLLLLFCFSSLPFVDFEHNAAPDGVWFVGGMSMFMSVLRFPCWFYVGVESLCLASNSTYNPRISIPRGQLSCMFTLFVCSMLVLFINCSLPIGITALTTELIPFNAGQSGLCCDV